MVRVKTADPFELQLFLKKRKKKEKKYKKERKWNGMEWKGKEKKQNGKEINFWVKIGKILDKMDSYKQKEFQI